MPAIKIVLTGPESTGKSTLAQQLANKFKGNLVTEFARKYVSGISRPYEYNDLETIAKKQISDFNQNAWDNSDRIIFFDTYLIITKVWFEVVYKTYPLWLEDELKTSNIDLFLLCAPDLPWFKDNVRENGGEMREWLFKEYEKNIIKYNFAYKIVEGFGISRLNNAVHHIEKYLASKTTFK